MSNSSTITGWIVTLFIIHHLLLTSYDPTKYQSNSANYYLVIDMDGNTAYISKIEHENHHNLLIYHTTKCKLLDQDKLFPVVK